MKNELTLLTCNYNTPELVINLLKSVQETFEDIPNILVANTSTYGHSEQIFSEYNFPFFNFRGGTHGEAVNLAMTKIQTPYVLLVDSDVIFFKDMKKPFEVFKQNGFSLMGNIVGDCAGKKLYKRVEPWCCFINLKLLKDNKIKFFDHERTKLSKISGDRVYDIGSTMYEDCEKLKPFIGQVQLEGKYFKHYGGMSWRIQSFNPSEKDTDIDFGGTHPNKALHDYGLQIREQYIRETEHFKAVDLML